MSKKSRKRKLGAEDKAVFEWEKNRIFPESLRDEMETMWEIPQIYHFLQLTKDAFNITHLSMYEVERMLLMPKASRQLAHIMTCLLSSPSTIRTKQQKVPPMPYEFWTNILMYKLRSWFKMYQTKHRDPIKVFDTIGIEPEFWNIFPDANAIEGKDFQDFTFKQRVWLLKSICDTAMHSRKTIQDEMSKQPMESQFETVLGIDRFGARYVYFPQFLHNDLRVYRHCLDNKVLSTVKPPIKEVKPKLEIIVKQEPKAVPRVMSKKRRRKSRWSSGSLPARKKDKKKLDTTHVENTIIDSNSNSVDIHISQYSRSSSKTSELSCGSLTKSSGYETNLSAGTIDDSNLNENNVKCVNEILEKLKTQIEDDVSEKSRISEESVPVNEVDGPEKSLPKIGETTVKETITMTDDLSKSSKTDDEKLEEMNASKIVEKPIDLEIQLVSNVSKSDDEKLSETKKCDTTDSDNCISNTNFNDKSLCADNSGDDENSDSGTRRSARIKNISEVKTEVEEIENMLDVCESEELCSIDLRDSLCRVSSPESEFECSNLSDSFWNFGDFNELINDLSVSNFQLVADSLDSLKELTEYISSDKTLTGHESKQDNFRRPSCEEKLLKRLKVLLASLENVEGILKESTKKARNKLQREWNNFENGVADEDQDAEDSDSHRWVVNSQGTCPFPALASLSNTTLSGISINDESTRSTSSSDFIKETTNRTEAKTEFGKSADESFKIEETTCRNEETSEKSHKTKGDDEKKECKGEGYIEREKKDNYDEEKGCKSRQEENGERKKGEAEPEQTKRVLRRRGISSYTEQLYDTDEESGEDQLDGWSDIEAVYATSSTQASTSTPDVNSKAQNSSWDDTEEEDSDQDWILPSSRKRNRKRPSASRRLRTLQHKIQNIKADQATNNQSSSQIKDQKPSPSKLPLYPIKTTPIKILPNSTKNTPIKISPKPSPIKPNIPNTLEEKDPLAQDSTTTVPLNPEKTLKLEGQDPNLHSVLDIKDEGPIFDPVNCAQPNYVVVSAGHAPVANYYVMQQNPPVTAVVQQNPFIQQATFVPQIMPQAVPAEGFYMQSNPAQGYIVQNPPGLIAATSTQAYIATTTPQLVYQQQPPQFVASNQQPIVQAQAAPNYVQYVTAPTQPQVSQIQQQQVPQIPQQQPPPVSQQQHQTSQPRIINTMTIAPPRVLSYRLRAPPPNQVGIRMPYQLPRQSFPHPNGAVIRSAPIVRPGQRLIRTHAPPRRQAPIRAPLPNIAPTKPPASSTTTVAKKTKEKSTSLIVLSDSDDEIEMIIPADNKKSAIKTPIPPQSSPSKPTLPPELMQRVNEGGISISPIKPAPQPQISQNTQLVVVVNETGSHYALALPNGGKLILTPEQVAQIRASNGGKLVL